MVIKSYLFSLSLYVCSLHIQCILGKPTCKKSEVFLNIVQKAAELAALVSHARRQLSITAVREQAKLLLERLQILGEGTAEAARRRERAASAELTARRERQAQLVCMRQGKAILRRGFALLA